LSVAPWPRSLSRSAPLWRRDRCCQRFRTGAAFMKSWEETFSQPDSQYSTSMLRDIERGGQTEVEHILGFMLDKAIKAQHAVARLHQRQGFRATAGRRPLALTCLRVWMMTRVAGGAASAGVFGTDRAQQPQDRRIMSSTAPILWRRPTSTPSCPAQVSSGELPANRHDPTIHPINTGSGEILISHPTGGRLPHSRNCSA
jgi:hypothetical protein